MLTIGDKDIKRSTIIPAGTWVRAKLTDFEQAAASTDGSALYKYEATILKGEYEGVPVNFNFSEKAPGFAIPFLKALGAEIKAGAFDMAKPKGMDIDLFIKNKMYEGRMRNEVADYAPAGSMTGE
jgi:hypothetical protein